MSIVSASLPTNDRKTSSTLKIDFMINIMMTSIVGHFVTKESGYVLSCFKCTPNGKIICHRRGSSLIEY